MAKFLKRRLSLTSLMSGGAASSAGGRPPVPESECKLRLDGNTLTLDNAGNWHLDPSTVGNFEAEIDRLQQYVRQLESEKRVLRERCAKSAGEKHMMQFQNQLLMELLAVAQLDANKNNEAYQKEALRTEALKWELGKWALGE